MPDTKIGYKIMASLDMIGPFHLDSEEVRKQVTKVSPGNYAFGVSKEDGFYVKYVGRSDSNVRQEIIDRMPSYPQCSHFKYSYAASEKAAFEKECKNYHDFGESKELLNKIHPDQPDDTNYHCPICGAPLDE